jgi:hypothetical protein
MAPRDRNVSENLSFKLDPPIAARLNELQDLVRRSGHARPSQKTFVQALIHHAPREGRQLELDVLVPYRRAHGESE